MKKTTLLTLVLVLCTLVGISNADFTFGEPTNLGPNVNTDSGEGNLSLSTDNLSIYFGSDRPGGYGGDDLWITTRKTTNDDWAEPVNLGSVVNSSSQDSSPSISADGLSLYFTSNRPGAVGGSGWNANDLWVAKRETTADDWGTPSNLGQVVNSSVADTMSYVSVDGLSLYFSSVRPGGLGQQDLWVSTRATTDDEWGEPLNLGPTVNTSSNEYQMWISQDGLMLLLQSDRPRTSGAVDIYMTTRATTNDDWTEPVNIGPIVNIPEISEGNPIVSSDGSTLYMTIWGRIGGYGNWDLWQSPIMPIVDLNNDGIVDATDMCIMVDYWGTDEPLCDIGPMPWGDGVVDVEDLKVLAEHLFTSPGAVAYWTLDETEGDIANDNAGNYNGTLVGNPIWQPDGGMVGGALEFDGVEDYISTDFVLNPIDGPFSVFAWIKGGEPGQVVISQQNGSNWLGIDSDLGYLMTELIPPAVGRFTPQPLKSESVITDGQWHRIGFVWDGVNRSLYVDDILVAEDTQANLQGSDAGLYIGTGKAMELGTYWSGLIDDVRIYNRAVKP